MTRKTATFLALAIICALTAVSCGSQEEVEGEAYALVYNEQSLCKAEVRYIGNDVTYCHIDEVMLIDEWTKQALFASGDVADEDLSIVTENEQVVTRAKKARFGDKIFTLSPQGNYIGVDGQMFIEWLKSTEANMKYYWEKMEAGDYCILKDNGEMYSVEYSPYDVGEVADKNKRFFKRRNGYWKTGSYGKGYEYNITAIENFVKAKGAGYSVSAAVKSDGGSYVLGGIDTGATISGFSEYYALVKKAVEAKTKKILV